MKQSILIIIILYFSASAVCQNSYNIKSKLHSQRQINALGEIGGNGVLFSLGLELAKYDNNALENTFRWGFSFLEYSVFGEYNINFGRKKNYFELGFGPTLYYNERLDLLVFGRIGYRYDSDNFIFRAGFTPSFAVNDEFFFRPSFGFTFGIPLKQF